MYVVPLGTEASFTSSGKNNSYYTFIFMFVEDKKIKILKYLAATIS
jgi:hypothetical protein